MSICEFSFTFHDEKNSFPSSIDRKDQLVQYNLDKSLKVKKFKFHGSLNTELSKSYEKLIKDALKSPEILSSLELSTLSLDASDQTELEALNLTVKSLEFFDKFKDSNIVGANGRIKGCLDETFGDLSVGDLLREHFVNENSENSEIFNEEEKKEFIYQLMKLFAIGGSLCQPDVIIDKYIDITKEFYKSVITIYRETKSNEVKLSGKVFKINHIPGVFESNRNPQNVIFIIVDPLKKIVTFIKNEFVPFW